MIIEEAINFLKATPPFQFLTEAVLREVAADLTLEFHPCHTIILAQDGSPAESLQIIKKGAVKVVMHSTLGDEMVLDYRCEGDSFGFLSLVGKERQQTSVVAVEDTLCYQVPRARVQALLESTPAFTEYFLQAHLSKYAQKTFSEMQNRSLYYGSSDRLLFTTRIGDIATRDVVTVAGDVTIREAAQVMVANRISSLIVVDAAKQPQGIVTDRDIRVKVVAPARDSGEPVRAIMSRPIVGVEAGDYCFEAVLRMIRHNIHHVIVTRDGHLCGILTNHDLMLLQGHSPLSFARDIEGQTTLEGLTPVAAKVNVIIRLLLKEGARAGNITRIMAELNDRLLRKILAIAEAQCGPPPAAYCWICFGSEGRKEQTFRTDQDNAIIYADAETPEQAAAAQAYFRDLARIVTDALLACGFPRCPADYMASNPTWCQPLRTWRKYFLDWVSTPTGEALLKALIVFDFRPIHGEARLATDLRTYLNTLVADQAIFLGHLANMILKNAPPVGFLKSFVVERDGAHKNELNLKVKGLAPLVDIMRLFSLEKGIAETATLDRVQALRGRHTIVEDFADEIEHAFEFIMLLRMHHQLKQIESGAPPDNFVDPNQLTHLERRAMKDAFKVTARLQDLIMQRYRSMIL